MNPQALIRSLPFFLLSALIVTALAQPNLDSPSGPSSRPSTAIIIAIMSIILSLCFLLLVFTKIIPCGDHPLINRDPNLQPGGTFGPQAQDPVNSSGIERTVVESLPFFRFSSLRGSRKGLECSVCLSKFNGEEILRLLPMCKHAFHLDCLDQWLESHSTCPLCRHRIDPNNPNLFKYSNSSRCLFGVNKDEISTNKENADDEPLYKSRRQIVALGVVFRRRWSDLSSFDLVSLNSDTLIAMSSEQIASRSEAVNRCTSEINSVSRFEGAKNISLNSDADDKVRGLWLSIAQRTVQWLVSGRERREFVQSREDTLV